MSSLCIENKQRLRKLVCVYIYIYMRKKVLNMLYLGSSNWQDYRKKTYVKISPMMYFNLVYNFCLHFCVRFPKMKFSHLFKSKFKIYIFFLNYNPPYQVVQTRE